MRYILTVDRAAIDRGERDNLIRIVDQDTGRAVNVDEAVWNGYTSFQTALTDADELQDGSRAWVTTESPIVVLTDDGPKSVTDITLDNSSGI